MAMFPADERDRDQEEARICREALVEFMTASRSWRKTLWQASADGRRATR